MRAAIAAGYGKGFATIVDANVVTAITAMVLFLVATAGVKGFALMLLIGTLISLLTAVAATRAILGLLGRLQVVRQPASDGRRGRDPPKWIRRDFVGRRGTVVRDLRRADRCSRSAAIAVKGLNLGIDFEGGTQGHVHDARAGLARRRCATRRRRSGRSDASDPRPRRRRRAATTTGSSRSRPRSSRSAEQRELTQALDAEFERRRRACRHVSASFGRQIARRRDPRDPRLAPADLDLHRLPLRVASSPGP